MITWNTATSLRLIWLLFFRSGSIWVAWFVKVILDNNISNFWTIVERNSHSWLVKRLLRLRPLIYNWILIDVGNGRSTSFWNDNWSPFGRLSDFFHLPPRTRLGIPQTATLADLYRNGAWALPAARSEEQVLFMFI